MTWNGEEAKSKIEEMRSILISELEIDASAEYKYPATSKLEDFPTFPATVVKELKSGKSLDRLARTFDHTLLKTEGQPCDIEKLCNEALESKFYSVCVNSLFVKQARELLKDSKINLAAVVGFPLGAMSSAAKAEEARLAVADGADEIDMVLSVGLLKAGENKAVFEDIKAVVKASKTPVKVIIETCLLSDEEKIKACLIAVFAKVAFVKTSTGFSSGGATVEDIALMRATVGESCGVKASGGVRTLEKAIAMLEAGANRIGTSSGAKILEEGKSA